MFDIICSYDLIDKFVVLGVFNVLLKGKWSYKCG